MKYAIAAFFVLSLSILSLAQTTIEYPYCKCTETIHYASENSKVRQGEYNMVCNGVTVEQGNYANDLKDGTWTSFNKKGVIIAKIEYATGKLNGAYDLFQYTGKPKVKAQFADGLPTGTWQYFSEKEKSYFFSQIVHQQ